MTAAISLPPLPRRVFCNRTLNMRSIQVVGCDMDYTLVHYDSERWERSAYAYMKRAFEARGWPVADLHFDPELVSLGLVIDVERGNLAKANRFGHVRNASHGTALGNLPDSRQREAKSGPGADMSELDDFLTPTLARQLEAERALINGDPGPRLAMWSTQDPLTVFGAMQSNIGSEEVRGVFRWLATRFSNGTDYRFELVAAGASGDLAYTLGYEHVTFSMDGGPVEPHTLRVTHVYRREDGEWKTIHRHADAPPTVPLRSADASTE